jgi:multidrug efflux pump subunit AcrB
MWIVRLALRRPYTFVVAAMLVIILGIVTIVRMPTDIFPEIDIPVVSCVFNYPGMSASDMEKRVVNNFERFLVTVVNDIDHVESQSLNGIAVVKVFFQPGAKIEAATAQLTAVAQTSLRQMPPGMQPPLIIRYSATNVPILQLSLSSDRLSEQQLFDLGINQLRPQLITIPGIQVPFPYGGKQRQVMIDLDPEKLDAFAISPTEVSDAINAQNLILPSGTAKIGVQEYPVRLNSSTDTVAALNDIPIKTIRGTPVYIRDVAHVRDGFSVQTNMVHANGKRGVLIPILKAQGASTLDVVTDVKAALPRIQATLPPDLKIDLLFDQSLFVRASIEGVVKEAAIAAGLTGIMILMFLGSWRSTVIVMVSIPLSILISIIILAALGQTLNVMTLGGMALVVGILVDDATVEIENIHRNLHMRKRLIQAILDGASQIAVPAFVSMLCICIVFVPVVFITGPARYLFTPLAMAVVFAMMASYLLSRTLVPTMVHYLLAAEVERYGGVLDPNDPHSSSNTPTQRPSLFSSMWLRLSALVLAGAIGAAFYIYYGAGGPRTFWHTLHQKSLLLLHSIEKDPYTWLLWAGVVVSGILLLFLFDRLSLLERWHRIFDAGFRFVQRIYGGILAWCLGHKTAVLAVFALILASAVWLFPMVGADYFPSVDAGLIRMHVRTPPGTRIEETERYYAKVSNIIRRVIPEDQITAMLDNIGIPYSGINLSLSDGTMTSPADGEFLISLKDSDVPTHVYIDKIRKTIAAEIPELTVFAKPPDMVTQVLNFGLAAPIDVQISGPQRNDEANYQIAQKLKLQLAQLPGVTDIRLAQVTRTPDIRLNVDRVMARQMGLTQREVANNLLISLSSSGQAAPNFWLDPRTGVSYGVSAQTPQYRIDSVEDLNNAPIPVRDSGTGNTNVQLMGNLASLSRGYTATNITHYTLMPTYDIHMNVANSDLQSVATLVQKAITDITPDLPRGSTIALRGQIESMHSSFTALAWGLVFAIVLVYLLMVINFQSWLDPLIILMALPGALAGIIWILFATQTPFSVPALMGAIMTMGVGTANAILMITFANDQRALGLNARDAALAAGMTRLRPVVMTACAMLIGMLPMALGFGEGGEQNAPLGRAVIGGLILATFSTLVFVPIVYSMLRTKPPQTQTEPELQ